MFRKMPFVLIALILAIMLLDPIIPLTVKQILYSISLSIKSVIISLLPFIIFSLLFKSVVTLSRGATKVIGLILLLVCCSNFISTFLSHYVGAWIYGFDLPMITPHESQGLKALWTLTLPRLIPNDYAMFSAIIIGFIATRLSPENAKRISLKLEKMVNTLLKAFTYIIPVFVAGFVVKLQVDDVMGLILKDYASIFGLIALAQFSYIILGYLVLNNFQLQDFLRSLKNMIPAAISGFSTMSSAASMPLTMIGAEKNTQNKEIARSVIPATVNIHLIGDCFAIPICAYAALKSFGIEEPSLFNYLIFTSYFVLAKFSVAAIPGGGIIVMLPILEKYLGFTGEMMSLITALYILFDPVVTSANVLGNGAFAQLIDKLQGKKPVPVS